MTTEQYQIGYEEGYQEGWNAAMGETPLYTALSAAPEAIAKLRHLYNNLMCNGVRSTEDAKRIAQGLLAQAIEALDRAAATSEQQAASSAVLKAIRDANMQLVRTGDDAFMLVPYKVATAEQAAPNAAPVKACVCGEPQAPGTVHRVDGPCYVVAPQPADCTRSHPHEDMSSYCLLRTEIARLANENARLKASQPVVRGPAKQKPASKTLNLFYK